MSAADPAITPSPPPGRAALLALIEQRRAAPFAWGVHDCCLWAADAVQAQSGTDPAADVRGCYATQAEAEALLQQLGGLVAVGARVGLPFAPRLAMLGDIGLVQWRDRQSLAVCTGEQWLVPGRRGLVALPFNTASHAWQLTTR